MTKEEVVKKLIDDSKHYQNVIGKKETPEIDRLYLIGRNDEAKRTIELLGGKV